MSKAIQLKNLKPGEMFRREPGGYRYVKGTEENRDEVYCFNIDGESMGYHHPKKEWVVGILPTDRVEAIPAPFYMCMVKGGGVPRQVHTNISTAQGEAERLSRVNSGGIVFLLRAIAQVVYNRPQESAHIWKDIPE